MDNKEMSTYISQNERSPKCRGVLGWIFGHKYAIWNVNYGKRVYDRCVRCGYKRI